jgi:hypothetical protein
MDVATTGASLAGLQADGRKPEGFPGVTVRDVTARLLVAAAFVSSWNAVVLLGIQPVDVFLAVAVALSTIYLVGGKMPWVPVWVKWATACILIVILTHKLFPTSASYLSQRFIFVPWFVANSGIDLMENGAIRGAKWILALAVLPVLVADSARRNPQLVPRLANAWLLGAAVSALVAVMDLVGITSINTALIVLGRASGRQAGLTAHPNHLGLSIAMVAPLAIGVAIRSRWKGVPLMLLLIAGVVVSGSRAGQAGFVLAVAATLALSTRARRFAPTMIVAAGVAAAAVVWVRPNLIELAGNLFRFDTTDSYVLQSNEERANLSVQAIADFAERPVDGVGLEVLTQAHNIHLQIIASGGLILALGMLIYFIGAIRAGFAERRSAEPLGLYLLIAISVWLAAGTFGTQLTDRYLYFPVAGIAALQYHRTLEAKRRRRQLRDLAAARVALIDEQPAVLSA